MMYKKREKTDFIIFEYKDTGCKDFETFYKQQRREGNLDTGYHFYVDKDGCISHDRPIDKVAGYDKQDSERSVYVLFEGKKRTDCQTQARDKLAKELREQFEGSTVINTLV